jgi:hypothetical protein
MDDREKEQLQKTFKLVIQQMQTSESIMETILESQPLTHEPFGLLRIRIGFGNNETIIEKQDVFQEIGQQLQNSKHTLTLHQLMHLALDLKQDVVFRVLPSS